jgi:hypothetical protein
VVEDEAVEGISLPGSCGAEEEGVCAIVVGMLALDLRLEPNPRPLKREFIELMKSRRL